VVDETRLDYREISFSFPIQVELANTPISVFLPWYPPLYGISFDTGGRTEISRRSAGDGVGDSPAAQEARLCQVPASTARSIGARESSPLMLATSAMRDNNSNTLPLLISKTWTPFTYLLPEKPTFAGKLHGVEREGQSKISAMVFSHAGTLLKYQVFSTHFVVRTGCDGFKARRANPCGFTLLKLAAP
jgi:hypothetical protein